MSEEFQIYGIVRRTDLHLRIQFYGLKTKIYQIEENHYAIHILNYMEKHQEIKAYFDNKIRPAGEWIDLVLNKPEKIWREIDELPNIAYHQEGIFLTISMFQDLLVSRFPDIDFVDVQIIHENGIKCCVIVKGEITNTRKEQVICFIRQMCNPYTEVEVKSGDIKVKALYNADVMSACTDSSQKYSVRDAEFWFDNTEKIYSGKTKKQDLPFFDDKTTKCYMDFSIWDNINIRNCVLLYDKVYISFPLGEKLDEFLLKQNLSERDLELMVERNKIVIMLPNTENRYNTKLVSRLFDINPSCVVSKRGINSLIAIFFCELEKKYLSFWESRTDLLGELYMKLRFVEDERTKILADWLIWPIKEKVESFELLNSYGPMKLASIGINNLLNEIVKKRDDIQFELTVNSYATHIAAALQATYYPFQMEGKEGTYSDTAVASILGSIINCYQYGNENRTIQTYTEMMQAEQNAIRLLRSETRVDMKHFIDYAEKYRTSTQLKNIILSLESTPEIVRRKKITEYNNLIAELGEQVDSAGSKILKYVLTGAGFAPVIGTGASVISLVMQILGDIKGLEKTHDIRNIQKIGNCAKEDAEAVFLLDRINRIAKIQ